VRTSEDYENIAGTGFFKSEYKNGSYVIAFSGETTVGGGGDPEMDIEVILEADPDRLGMALEALLGAIDAHACKDPERLQIMLEEAAIHLGELDG